MICAIVTHNTDQAHRIADRAMIIEQGKLVAIGPTKGVLDVR
jgi:putative ABC transport system ATP-binding protein